MSDDKLYVCVLDEFPDFMTPTLVAHAVLRHHVAKCGNERYNSWLKDSFKKCVVRVNKKEFLKIQALPESIESWESTQMGGSVSCVTVLANNKEYNVLKFAKLWKPL